MESEVKYNCGDTLHDRSDTEIHVTEPAHYTRMKIQPITYIVENNMEFWRGNIVKYASRAGFKLYEGKDTLESEVIDLGKVIRNAEIRINQIKEYLKQEKFLESLESLECNDQKPKSTHRGVTNKSMYGFL